MNVKISGYESAPLVPVGATLTRAYWQVPGLYGGGPEFATKDLALEYAISELEEAIARHEESSARMYPEQALVPLPERIFIDYRWTLVYPGNAGGLDGVVQRSEYTTLESAKESLALYRRFSAGETR